MNKDRRKRISALIEQIENLSADVVALADEEQEAFDNLPESLQDGERGQAMSDAVDKLNDAASDLSNAATTLSETLE